jgi:hypothetical protein
MGEIRRVRTPMVGRDTFYLNGAVESPKDFIKTTDYSEYVELKDDFDLHHQGRRRGTETPHISSPGPRKSLRF